MGLNMKKFIIKDPIITTSIPEDDIEYSIPSYSDLEYVCEAFTHFLKACGYNLDGQYVAINYHDDLK